MEQLVFVEVQPTMDYQEIEQKVRRMLKGYPKLEGRIRIAKRRAEGKGITFFDPLRNKLKEEQLATIGRAYTAGNKEYMHQEKAENLFHSIKGDDAEDEQMLDEIRGVMIGTRAWEGLASVTDDGKVKLFEVAQAESMQKARRQVEELENEKETIDLGMEELQVYRPDLEKLLRDRYIKDKCVLQVCREMNISEKTYDRRKKEAICEFAMLVGITEG